MKRDARPLTLLLAALWLPAMLHCELEAAGAHLLTHCDHHSPADDGDGPDDEHPLEDAVCTIRAVSMHVPAAADSSSEIPFAPLGAGRDYNEPAVCPPCHEPPPEWRVGWQFLTRAAPPARAPASNT